MQVPRGAALRENAQSIETGRGPRPPVPSPPPSTRKPLWRPNPGQQEKFIALGVFEALYGGAKGGGKSDAILFGALRQIDKPLYKALILRETYPELRELIRRARRVFSKLPERPKWVAADKTWVFPSGASITFGHCRSIDDVEKYQGQEWAYIGFDELGNVADEQVWTDLLKEIRCPDPTVVRMARASANPGYAGQAWLKRRFVTPCGKKGERIHWFVEELPNGVVAKQARAFVPATVFDNPTYARDPDYLATLYQLPEPRRSQLLHGDWDSGGGLALPELDETVHVRAAALLFPDGDVPDHWPRFGSFDWGHVHPWSFGEYCVDEEGTVYKLQTVTGRGHLPNQIAERIHERVDVERLAYIVAGHDVDQHHQARSVMKLPTIMELLAEYGIHVEPVKAGKDSRKQTLNNFRHYIKWLEQGPVDPATGLRGHGAPSFFLVDNPGNRRAFDQLVSMVCDPDDPEDALKVNANRDTGEGGDDIYDETRIALASRPWNAQPLKKHPTHREGVARAVKSRMREIMKRILRQQSEEEQLAGDDEPLAMDGDPGAFAEVAGAGIWD